MKPFVVNRYGRIVFPFNFFPALDFSVFQTLDQFAAVIKREVAEQVVAPVVGARVDSGDDVGLGRGLLLEVTLDHGGELVQRLEDGEVQRREKVEGKDDPTVPVDDEWLHVGSFEPYRSGLRPYDRRHSTARSVGATTCAARPRGAYTLSRRV